MSGAVISPCGTYRYVLRRRIPSALRWVRPILFVMLNPSTADATKDDPTIRRCISFAKREGYIDITVVNLFALRATNPKELASHPCPIGPDNAAHLDEQVRKHRSIGGIIVAAWGAHPVQHRYESVGVLKMALHNAGALCLGITSEGQPRHPLYVPANAPLAPWKDPRYAN